MKLEIELIPKTAWFTNLRSYLAQGEWDIIRKKCYREANHRCEICNGRGPDHPVECHETWNFSEGKITLTGLIALCPACHEVKHIGLAQIKGRGQIAREHFMKVNDINRAEAEGHIIEAFNLYIERSKQKSWELDVSYLKEYLNVNKGP